MSDPFLRLVFLVTATLFVVLGLHGPSDVPEGFYAVAGELTGAGRVPYRDYFYPQAPLFPYLLGLFSWLAHPGFVTQRVLMALFAAGTATLVAYAVKRATRSNAAAVAAVLWFATHELAWQHLPTVKPYAAGTLLATWALVLVTGPDRPTPAQLLAAGILAAAATGMRLLLAPVLLVALGWAAVRDSSAAAARFGVVALCGMWFALLEPPTAELLFFAVVLCAMALFLDRRPLPRLFPATLVVAGALIVVIPIYLLLYRPAAEAFLFDMLGYHAQRSSAGLIASLDRNSGPLHALFALGSLNLYSATGAQLVILYLLAGAGVLLPGRERVLPFVAAAAFLGAASLRASPSLERFFVVCVPLLAIAAGIAAAELGRWAPDRPFMERIALPAVALALFVALAIPSWRARWLGGLYSAWAHRPPVLTRVHARVAEAERRHPGPILATWPGSVIGSAAHLLPHFENHLARRVAEGVGPRGRERLKLHKAEDIPRAIAERLPSVVVLDRVLAPAARAQLAAHLAACGYGRFGKTIATTDVYVRDGVANDACQRPLLAP